MGLFFCSFVSSLLSQLGGLPFPCRTSYSSPQELRSSQCSAPSVLVLLSPSFTVPPWLMMTGRRSRRRCACFLAVILVPILSCSQSAPPMWPSKAPWSRQSATTCTSCLQSVREEQINRRGTSVTCFDVVTLLFL